MDQPGTSHVLERLAARLHDAAFDFAEPARSVQFAERRIADVEQICTEARAAVRGRAQPTP